MQHLLRAADDARVLSSRQLLDPYERAFHIRVLRDTAHLHGRRVGSCHEEYRRMVPCLYIRLMCTWKGSTRHPALCNQASSLATLLQANSTSTAHRYGSSVSTSDNLRPLSVSFTSTLTAQVAGNLCHDAELSWPGSRRRTRRGPYQAS